MTKGINLGIASELVKLISEFHYKVQWLKSEEGDNVTPVIASDIARTVQNYFATGQVRYPDYPSQGDIEEMFPIPPATFNEIERYITENEKPSDFVVALLANEPDNARRLADEFSLNAVDSIIYYLTRRAPPDCWGTREMVESWLNDPPQPRGRRGE